MNREEKIQQQIDLQEEIQKKSNINIVNCGSCGSVMLHRIVLLVSNEDYEIECPYCDFKSDPCDFPDFLYEGMSLE